MAFVTDPAGAWSASGSPAATRASRRAGSPAPRRGSSCSPRTTTGALEFYANAFGWTIHTVADTDDFRYSTLGKDEDALAGVMDASGTIGDAPSAWSVYFAVDDTDATVAAAEEAGGSVVRAAEDSPYGRIAELADPQGARFKILGPSRGGSQPDRGGDLGGHGLGERLAGVVVGLGHDVVRGPVREQVHGPDPHPTAPARRRGRCRRARSRWLPRAGAASARPSRPR